MKTKTAKKSKGSAQAGASAQVIEPPISSQEFEKMVRFQVKRMESAFFLSELWNELVSQRIAAGLTRGAAIKSGRRIARESFRQSAEENIRDLAKKEGVTIEPSPASELDAVIRQGVAAIGPPRRRRLGLGKYL